MRHRISGILPVLMLTVTACSSQQDVDDHQSAQIEYDIPENVCKDEVGETTPRDFFPPGDELAIFGEATDSASGNCHLEVDGDLFFTAMEYLTTSDIEYLSQVPDHGEPEGDPTQVTSDHQIFVWENTAVARTTCTLPTEFEDKYYALIVGVVPPDDLQNTRELLQEYITEAFDEAFHSISFCEESDASSSEPT